MNQVTVSNPAGRPRIGINAHLLSAAAGYRRAGIHHYIYELLTHLPQSDEGPLYTVYTRHENEWLDRPDMAVVTTRLPTHKRAARILWEQTAWPLDALRRRLDLLHSMAFVAPPVLPCPLVATIYDLSFIMVPQTFLPNQRRYLHTQTKRTCRIARRLIAISESGKQDIHRVYDVPLERIDVVRPGLDKHYRPLPPAEVAAFRAAEELPERFLLHVGTLQPRKNIPRLIAALDEIADRDMSLIFVGGLGWLYADFFTLVRSLGLDDRVRFVGYVPDEMLPYWYNAATALVYPSFYEGFGLPIIEAMACGTPVVAANTSSIPEAGGSNALYFDPYDLDELVQRMDQILGDEGLASRLGAAGPAQAQQFTWDRAGQDLLAVYQRALAS